MFSCPKAQSAGPGTDALITPYRLRRRPAHAVRVEMDAAGLRLLSCEQSTIGPLRGDRCAGASIRINPPLAPSSHSVYAYRPCASSCRTAPLRVHKNCIGFADAAASRRGVVRARHHFLGAVRLARCRCIGIAGELAWRDGGDKARAPYSHGHAWRDGGDKARAPHAHGHAWRDGGDKARAP